MHHLIRACRRLKDVHTRYDPHGNLLAWYRRSPQGVTPLAFVAHTDHPGFVALDALDHRTLRAAFRGGVKPEYFADARVRFWSGGAWVKGQILEISKATSVTDVPGWTFRVEEVLVRVAKPAAPKAPGIWDLPDPILKGDLVRARCCDDLAGVAALLTLLQRLSRKRARAEVYCLFTRAEEVGFVGAVAAARSRTLPRRLPVISIETSSAFPHAPVGAGPILRVGDRAAVFSPALIAFCERVAKSLAGRRKDFVYQRKLMDGGTCEAVPFLAYGYQAAGICLALGNYHNMDQRRRKIASESISLSDWRGMVDWFEALVLDTGDRDEEMRPMRERLESRFAQHEPLLRA